MAVHFHDVAQILDNEAGIDGGAAAGRGRAVRRQATANAPYSALGSVWVSSDDARTNMPVSGSPPHTGAEQRGAHARPVAGGVQAAAGRRRAEPELEAGEEGGLAGPGGPAEEPPAEAAGEVVAEADGVAAGAKEGLGDEAGVFGVVGEEAAAEEELVAVGSVGEEATAPPPGKASPAAGRARPRPRARGRARRRRPRPCRRLYGRGPAVSPRSWDAKGEIGCRRSEGCQASRAPSGAGCVWRITPLRAHLMRFRAALLRPQPTLGSLKRLVAMAEKDRTYRMIRSHEFKNESIGANALVFP